jgi:uncharacterized protein
MGPLQIDEPALLIRINKTYEQSMSSQSLYDYTRGRWKVNPIRAKNAKYGISIFDGIVQEVYEIHDWHQAGTTESSRKPNDKPELNSTKSLIGRFEFKGEVAPGEIRDKYLGKSVRHLFAKGNANPIKYVNL